MFVAYDEFKYNVLALSNPEESFEEFTDQILFHREIDIDSLRIAQIIPIKFKIVKDEQ